MGAAEGAMGPGGKSLAASLTRASKHHVSRCDAAAAALPLTSHALGKYIWKYQDTSSFEVQIPILLTNGSCSVGIVAVSLCAAWLQHANRRTAPATLLAI